MQRLRKFERALIEGEWYNHAKATKTFGDIAIGIGLVVGAGATAYSANKQAGIANRGLSVAEDQQYKEDQAFNQLQDLISNPAAFFSSPVYKSAADQGSKAVARSSAASFGPNSGNEKTALQSFGQSFGQQQFFQQEELLAGMSGSGFNPSGALGGASSATGAAAGSLNSLAGLLSFFGSSGMGSGGGSTAVSFGASSPEIDTSGVVSDTPISSGPW